MTVTVEKSPIKAIRAYCLDCSDTPKNILNCHLKNCPLWEFRLGRNPFIKRQMTEEHRAASAERLARARATKGAPKEKGEGK